MTETEETLIEKLRRNVKHTANENITENLEKQDKYEMVNHPKHYNNYDVEVIEMMERIWGLKETINFCSMNAFKYRMRMGTKPDQDISQDLKKEQWYLKKADELKSKLLDKSIDMNQ